MVAAKFAKQMLHMPGVGASPPPFVADTFQIAQTNGTKVLPLESFVPTICRLC
jgi:hypothetical protein